MLPESACPRCARDELSMRRAAPSYNGRMKIRNRRLGIAKAVTMLLLTVLALNSRGAAADESTRHAAAPTRPSLVDLASGRRDRLEFGGNEFKGWVDRSGDWHVEGDVAHVGLLCADYQMGLRFGKGSPGCTNVKWLGEVLYGSRRTQCNGATVKHSAWQNDPGLGGYFDEISCAEQVIRCTGNCK